MDLRDKEKIFSAELKSLITQKTEGTLLALQNVKTDCIIRQYENGVTILCEIFIYFTGINYKNPIAVKITLEYFSSVGTNVKNNEPPKFKRNNKGVFLTNQDYLILRNDITSRIIILDNISDLCKKIFDIESEMCYESKFFIAIGQEAINDFKDNIHK